jgi:hypothetical protein
MIKQKLETLFAISMAFIPTRVGAAGTDMDGGIVGMVPAYWFFYLLSLLVLGVLFLFIGDEQEHPAGKKAGMLYPCLTVLTRTGTQYLTGPQPGGKG